MKKKILIFALLVSLVFATGAPVSFATQVSDITGHRSEMVIREAMDLGVIKGYPDGTYRPDGNIKREEFFSIINNILTHRPDTTNTKLNFIDVDTIEWYVPIVKTMVEAKITNGIWWDKVGIGLNITRQEAVKILASIIPTNDLFAEPIEIAAKDKENISIWALPYYQILLKKGYLNNTTETLGPRVELTREEAAILLLKIKKGERVIAGNADEIVASLPTQGGCITTSGHSSLNGAFLIGDGSEKEPYRVSTQDQLNHVREHASEGAFFFMTNDIVVTEDFTKTAETTSGSNTDWSIGNFQPIGSKDNPFIGTFNGNGHKIEGLIVMGTVSSTEIAGVRELASYVGLFGKISEDSVVSNLLIDNSQISGKEYTGGIAGSNEGTIKNAGIGVKAILKGGSFTGGIAGYNGKFVENCFSNVDIQGKTVTGALVGKNYGVLRNSYWLRTSYPESVGSTGLDSSIVEVKQVSLQEFIDQNIEGLLKQN